MLCQEDYGPQLRRVASSFAMANSRACSILESIGYSTHSIRFACAWSPTRDPWLVDEQLDVIVKSGVGSRAEVVDLKDYQRALVWIDGASLVCSAPASMPYWLGTRDLLVELIDARKARFEHEEINDPSVAPRRLVGWKCAS